MKYLPPLKSLQYFAIAGQCQSFKLAAQQLHVTQAAVSQQIKLLEEYFQFPLFDRSGRRTVLTEQGLRLLPYITKGFEELTQGVKAVSGDPKPEVLRISTLHSFTSLWLIPRLQDFQDQYPDIMVQLAPTNQLIDFSNPDIDLAIRMGRGKYKGLQERKILSDNVLLVCSPDLLKQLDASDPQAIFNLPWIEDTSLGIQSSMLECCKSFGIDHSVLVPIIRSNNASPLIDSAVAGRGFLMASSSLVVDHLRTGKLVKLLNYSSLSPYSLYLVAPPHHFVWRKVTAFENWFTPKVLESFSDLSQW